MAVINYKAVIASKQCHQTLSQSKVQMPNEISSLQRFAEVKNGKFTFRFNIKMSVVESLTQASNVHKTFNLASAGNVIPSPVSDGCHPLQHGGSHTPSPDSDNFPASCSGCVGKVSEMQGLQIYDSDCEANKYSALKS